MAPRGVMVAMSSIALTIFMAGLALAVATVTGNQVARYTMPPAVVLGVKKRFVPTVIRPFPVASALRCELTAFAIDPPRRNAGFSLLWFRRFDPSQLGPIVFARSKKSGGSGD